MQGKDVDELVSNFVHTLYRDQKIGDWKQIWYAGSLEHSSRKIV